MRRDRLWTSRIIVLMSFIAMTAGGTRAVVRDKERGEREGGAANKQSDEKNNSGVGLEQSRSEEAATSALRQSRKAKKKRQRKADGRN